MPVDRMSKHVPIPTRDKMRYRDNVISNTSIVQKLSSNPINSQRKKSCRIRIECTEEAGGYVELEEFV